MQADTADRRDQQSHVFAGMTPADGSTRHAGGAARESGTAGTPLVRVGIAGACGSGRVGASSSHGRL